MAITAIVLINAQPDAIATLAEQLADLDGVSEAHSVAGGDVDLVAVVKVASHDAIAAVVTESIAKLPGIQKTNTLIAFRSYSHASLDAAYEGFEG